MRTWKDNADEFGALIKQGKDIRLALLVACSVEKGKGQGARQPHRNHDEVGKTSAQAFAAEAGISADRVLRHLNTWNKLAATGLVSTSDELEPDDAVTFVISDEALAAWAKIGLGPTTLDAIKGNPKKVIEALADPEFAAKIADSPAAVEAIVIQAIEQPASGAAIAKGVTAMQAKKTQEQFDKIGLKHSSEYASPEHVAFSAKIEAQNAVSDWLILVHEAAIKARAATTMWEKIEPTLTPSDLWEANASLVDIEADAVILRQRVSDKHASLEIKEEQK